jgi:hypothetical protein
VSGTPTSILADGAAGFFVFKAGTGRRLVRLFGLRGFLWSREEREGVFFTRRFAGGMGGREPGGSGRLFRFARAGPRFAGESRFYSLLLRVAIGFTPVFNTFVRFHKFDSVNDGRKS